VELKLKLNKRATFVACTKCGALPVVPSRYEAEIHFHAKISSRRVRSKCLILLNGETISQHILGHFIKKYESLSYEISRHFYYDSSYKVTVQISTRLLTTDYEALYLSRHNC
jgi:hypothetical protein